MIDIKEAIVGKLTFHRICNNNPIANDNLYEFEQDNDNQSLKKIFLKPFLSIVDTNEFKHDIDLDLNPLYMISKSIYEDDNFIEKSKDILQHLATVSKHPNIKDGDLFIVKFEDIILSNTYYEAIGIYKIENKDNFIETAINSSGKKELNLKEGINGKKLDKACLILFTEKPYTIFVIDNSRTETEYWVNDFINLTSKNDDINKTNHFLSLTKSFVANHLPQQFEISKADQVDFLNKSVKFFKENDNFNLNEFANEVIGQPEIIESFKQYKSAYQNDFDIEIADNFNISETAVKKQTRSLKSVIKLDKNFDIHIHGNRDLIEQGEDKKGKFYKVYYKEES
jgi:hypothetical protein